MQWACQNLSGKTFPTEIYERHESDNAGQLMKNGANGAVFHYTATGALMAGWGS